MYKFNQSNILKIVKLKKIVWHKSICEFFNKLSPEDVSEHYELAVKPLKLLNSNDVDFRMGLSW